MKELKPDIEFIRRADVIKLFHTSNPVFDRWQNPKHRQYRPDFPKKIKIGSSVFYVRSEVREYMEKLMQER